MIFMNACAGPAVPHTSKGQRVSKESKMFSAKLPPNIEVLLYLSFLAQLVYYYQINGRVRQKKKNSPTAL